MIDLICIIAVFVGLEVARKWAVYSFTRVPCRHPRSGPGTP